MAGGSDARILFQELATLEAVLKEDGAVNTAHHIDFLYNTGLKDRDLISDRRNANRRGMWFSSVVWTD